MWLSKNYFDAIRVFRLCSTRGFCKTPQTTNRMSKSVAIHEFIVFVANLVSNLHFNINSTKFPLVFKESAKKCSRSRRMKRAAAFLLALQPISIPDPA